MFILQEYLLQNQIIGIDNWERRSYNPIISPKNGEFDQDACYKPAAIYNENNDEWLVWYNGRTKNREYIGLYSHDGFDLFK